MLGHVALQGAHLGVQHAQVHPLVVIWWIVDAAIECNFAKLSGEVLTAAHDYGVNLHVIGQVDDHSLRVLPVALFNRHVNRRV